MRFSPFRLGCWLLAAALFVFAGCGESEQRTGKPVSAKAAPASSKGMREAWFSIDGYKGPQTIGILMAEKLGYFEDEGVEPTVTSAATPAAPLDYVPQEIVDFGVTRQPEVVLAKREGTPIVTVGALVARPTAALIWLKKSGIHGIADLKGKTIAIPGLTFQEDFLRTLLERHGLTLDDVKVSQLGYGLDRFLARGEADAIFGGSWDVEGAALAARGLKPVIRRVQNLGFPAYDEQVLVTRVDLASEDGPLVRDVLAALARGTAAAIEHPEAAVKLIEETGEADPNATPKVTEAEVEATLPLLSETGYMSPGQAEDLIDWMHAEGWIKRTFPSSRLITNDYLSIDES